MDTSHVTIRVDDSEDSVELPEELFSLFTEEDQTPASAATDLMVLDYTHRLHAQVHHTEDEPDERIVELEADLRDRFEDRFGASFGELTGHQH